MKFKTISDLNFWKINNYVFAIMCFHKQFPTPKITNLCIKYKLSQTFKLKLLIYMKENVQKEHEESHKPI